FPVAVYAHSVLRADRGDGYTVPDLVPHHGEGILRQCTCGYPLPFQRDRFSENEKVVDQFIDPKYLFFEAVEEFVDIVAPVGYLLLGEPFPDVTDGKGKEIKGVAYFVGDARRKLSYHRELFGFLQFVFQFFPFAQLVHHFVEASYEYAYL